MNDIEKIIEKLKQAVEQGSSYILTNDKCKILLEYLEENEDNKII